MKIIVLNFTKHKMFVSVLSVLIATVVLIALTVNIVTNAYNSELNIIAADTIPYEKVIILDAGHGGEDSGAVGVNGSLEKDINLEITLEIGKMLEEKGYIVVYTRTDDRLLYTEEENIHGIRKISDLKNRCKVAARYPESIFVSIHMNSFGSEKYSGLQVYYSENEKSKLLADSIQQKVICDLQQENTRKIKEGKNMYILENVSNVAVIVECGFLTNKVECEKLSQKEYKKELSFSIVCGIIEYIEENH